MNTRANPTQVSVGDDIVAGYRVIADTISSSTRDFPTPETDAAILSAALGNSRRRRARPARYVAIAAGAAAMGLAILTSSDHLDVPSTSESLRLESVAGARFSSAFESSLARLHNFQLPARVAPKNNGTGLNSLVLNAYQAGAELHTAAEVHTAAGASGGMDVQYTTIDLNRPGALERLARENPYHYAIIRRILAGVDEIPENAVGRWMQAQFNATDITYSSILLTSAPPKKELVFTLETTRYQALLTLTPDGARLFPGRP
jgi:hypothetical protein